MRNNPEYCHNGSIYQAILELKEQQDQLEGFPTSCFSSLLSKLFRVDTIPFILYTVEGVFELAGFEHVDLGECHYFHTTFFRIEHIDSKKECATLSLLRPLTLCGLPAQDIYDMERLERTNICVTVDLSCFSGVQCLDINLVKKVIIEPKW